MRKLDADKRLCYVYIYISNKEWKSKENVENLRIPGYKDTKGRPLAAFDLRPV